MQAFSPLTYKIEMIICADVVLPPSLEPMPSKFSRWSKSFKFYRFYKDASRSAYNSWAVIVNDIQEKELLEKYEAYVSCGNVVTEGSTGGICIDARLSEAEKMEFNMFHR